MDAFLAIYNDNIQALREYLELGDVNIKNERGMSLLHSAILFSNSEIFDLLLESYINVNMKDNYGNTPSHLCVIHNRLGFLKMLIRHNADLNIKNDEGQTPLYKACLLGRENMISLLLETQKFDLNMMDKNDESMFFALTRSRNLDLLNKVILDDEIVNRPNYKGEAPIHIAARSGDVKILDYLIQHKALVNLKTNQKETPLFYAVRGRSLDCIDLLLKNGAILDCKNKNGETIYDLVEIDSIVESINEKRIKYHQDEYISSYPLHYAILIEDSILVKKYANLRNIYRVDSYGFTPKQINKFIKNERIEKLLNEIK